MPLDAKQLANIIGSRMAYSADVIAEAIATAEQTKLKIDNLVSEWKAQVAKFNELRDNYSNEVLKIRAACQHLSTTITREIYCSPIRTCDLCGKEL